MGLRLLAALAVALVWAGPAFAGTVKLPAKIVYLTQAHPGPNDPGRCIGIAVVEYAEIKGATSYSIHAKGSKGSSDVHGGGPPFTQDTVSFHPALFKAPAGKHWVLLGSYSVGTGCADAEAGMAGRMTIASATANVPGPPPTTTKEEEKKASLAVAIRLDSTPAVGQTVDGRIVVTAGEQPVNGIRFTGDPLRASGKALTVVASPRPPPPFSLAAGGSRSFPFSVKAAAKGKASLRSGAKGTGPDGDPVAGSMSLPVEVGDAALLVTLETKPSKLALEVTGEGKVTPGKVTVEVRLKNTTRKPVTNVTLAGLFPQPAEEGQTPDQLAFDKKLLPVKVGTIAPGATFKRELPLAVTSDGQYTVRALATYAESARSPTQGATGTGGRFEITVPPLWFEARLEKSGLQSRQSSSEGWVKAGNTVLITGKVKNLSSWKTLCLAPLYAKGTGNAGGTGPIDIANYGPDEIAPPVAGKIKPADDVLIGLWVRTSVDGSPRATIEFQPKAGVVPEDGSCYATEPLKSPLKPDQMKVKKGSSKFTIHVDVRDPVFSATVGEVLAEFYGGFMYGAAKGSADFFSATFASVAHLLSPEALARAAVDPLGVYRGFAQAIKTAELLAHYWESATPEQRKNLYTRIGSVLAKARDDTWGKLRKNIDGAIDPWMNRVVGSYYRGDYKSMAHTLGQGNGYVGSQVALNIAVAEIGVGLLKELPRMSATFKEIGDTSRTYKTLRALPPGKLLNLRELKSLYGVAAEDLRKMAEIARKHGVRIGVKGRSPEAIAELRRGAVWKPEPVKPKNVNDIDRQWLGFKTRKGVVATKKFTAKEVQQIRERIASSNLSFEQKQAVIERLGVRLGEEKYLPELQSFAKRKRIDVGKNYRENGLAPEDAPFESELRAFELNSVKGSPGEYVPMMWNTSRGKMALITGDLDGLYIIAARGHALTAKQHLAILRELWEAGWQHPETLTWIRNGEFEFAAKHKILGGHALGAEAAMEIGPDGIARAVFIDLGKSLLFDSRAFWLDVVGGFVAR